MINRANEVSSKWNFGLLIGSPPRGACASRSIGPPITSQTSTSSIVRSARGDLCASGSAASIKYQSRYEINQHYNCQLPQLRNWIFLNSTVYWYCVWFKRHYMGVVYINCFRCKWYADTSQREEGAKKMFVWHILFFSHFYLHCLEYSLQ